MRTNKECPQYNRSANLPSVPVAVTEEQEEEIEAELNLVDQDLINVEGTKLKISKQVIERAEKVKRKSLVLKFPKFPSEKQKRKRAGTGIHCDYLIVSVFLHHKNLTVRFRSGFSF